jgi:hypothetical protein
LNFAYFCQCPTKGQLIICRNIQLFMTSTALNWIVYSIEIFCLLLLKAETDANVTMQKQNVAKIIQLLAKIPGKFQIYNVACIHGCCLASIRSKV